MTDWDYDKFKNNFPLLFSTECYFECGIGWKDIIWNLCEQLEPLCKKIRDELISDHEHKFCEEGVPQVTEIKQKYGSLRFYLSHCTDEMDEIIEDAERLSSVTCEMCGCPGKVRGRSWIKTLCESCL